MKNKQPAILLVALSLLFIHACKKEFSFENGKSSAGFLTKDSNGDCQPISVAGNFLIGQALTDSNFLEVEVNVTSPGSYSIHTDTANGYYFTASGSFQDTGAIKVRLPGKGTPAARGTDIFTVKYDGSTCTAAVTALNSIPDPAEYTLQGAPGACMNAAPRGNFIVNVALDTSSGVDIQVLVTTPGTYTISTTTVNGCSFSGSGLFVTKGSQWIRLAATGTPIAGGTDSFEVTAGASSCSFSLITQVPVAVINSDHFPLTAGSFWTYDHRFYLKDSVKRVVNGTAIRNMIAYTQVDEKQPFDPVKPLYFRKAGSEYYEYCSVDKYTGSVKYGDDVQGDILFLKEGLATGDSWQSKEYTAKASFGQVISVQYYFTCIDNNAVVNVNGKIFANVYKIKMQPAIKSEFAGYGFTGEVYEFYYAKGIGMIYVSKIQYDALQREEHLINWRVD